MCRIYNNTVATNRMSSNSCLQCLLFSRCVFFFFWLVATTATATTNHHKLWREGKYFRNNLVSSYHNICVLRHRMVRAGYSASMYQICMGLFGLGEKNPVSGTAMDIKHMRNLFWNGKVREKKGNYVL